MATKADLSNYVHELIGQRCEGVDNPIGSILLLDIGPVGRGPHQEEDSSPSGWRHLTIESPWRLQDNARVICDWNAPGGKNGKIIQVVNALVGHLVTQAHTSPPSWDLQLSWSNGMSLLVFSDTNEDRQDAWSILGTDGITIVVGPRQGEAEGWTVKWAK